MRLAAVAASDARTALFRVTAGGSLEERWLPRDSVRRRWSEWSAMPISARVVDVAAISGWTRQIEIFVLDADGGVWNRWWWQQRDWAPIDGFSFRGNPFGGPAANISALSAGGGHFNIFVTAVDGRIATLPHVDSFDDKWRPCPEQHGDLHDGWWPAFDYASDDVVYRGS